MGAHTGPYSVLVVDDDPEHAMLIRALFSHHDPNALVRVTQSAELAIAFLAEPWPDARGISALPDIIVLDLEMPGMGGLGFLEWYAESTGVQDVPVLVLTGTGYPQIKKRCLELGARAYHEKTADLAELVDLVQGILGRRRQPLANEAG